ncbi:hypothetical protein [Rhodococcus sp. PvP104]|uniref:hypothetical protein n=1 Tax=Rhodococcus sp. PvP104 TaxID=2817911 RepID=UPI001AE27FB9|nr:hypothetical protein [Rhodococcus sp. PvP104]MBP2523717.1 hypothetical protein [Rhodococcus sp. PvP104]
MTATWSDQPRCKAWNPEELEEVLIEKGARAKDDAPADTTPVTATAVQSIPAAVQTIIDNPARCDDGSIDRSQHMWDVVYACGIAGLSIEQAYGIALSVPSIAERWHRRTQQFISGELHSAFNAGKENGDREAERKAQSDADDATILGRIPAAELETLWDKRASLQHIYNYARSKRAAPWAVLVLALQRIVGLTEPNLKLPGIIGGPTSLNLFSVLVGYPGGGKGAAMKAAFGCFGVADGIMLDKVPLGSGEGLSHLYGRRIKAVPDKVDKDGKLLALGSPSRVEMHRTRLMVDAGEIVGMGAIQSRNGSTLAGELLKSWMGEQLGFSNADPERTIPIAELSYRMVLVAQSQPSNAGILLDGEGSGTPQRFLWVPVRDPERPRQTPPEPPMWIWPGISRNATGDVFFTYPQFLVDLIIDADDHRARTGDPERGGAHSMLSTLKVACAFALLEGRIDVNAEDWELAQMLIAKSVETREWCRAQIHAGTSNARRAEAEAKAHSEIYTEEVKERHGAERVAQTILTKLGAGPLAHAELLRKVAHRDRKPYFDQALDLLIERKQITVNDDGEGTTYQLT